MSKLLRIYDKLLAHYGELNWWPAQTSYEVMVGAILTQNTAWSNVEKAIANFGGRLTPQLIASLPLEELREFIRPSGFFNQKALYLKALTTWYAAYGYAVDAVQRHPLEKIRAELLKIKGVGWETADSILLYAFSYPSFVVDAYTKRLLERLPIEVELQYQAIKTYFEQALPCDAALYNNYHALIVINAKEHCKKQPLCVSCPLEDECRFKNVKFRMQNCREQGRGFLL